MWLVTRNRISTPLVLPTVHCSRGFPLECTGNSELIGCNQKGLDSRAMKSRQFRWSTYIHTNKSKKSQMRLALGTDNPGWSCTLPELVYCQTSQQIWHDIWGGGGGGGGGDRREVCVEVCSQGLHTLTPFKTCSLFANLFKTWDLIFFILLHTWFGYIFKLTSWNYSKDCFLSNFTLSQSKNTAVQGAS